MDFENPFLVLFLSFFTLFVYLLIFNFFSTVRDTFFTLYMSLTEGDNCIQNIHLGRYIIRYIVCNLILWQGISGAVKISDL